MPLLRINRHPSAKDLRLFGAFSVAFLAAVGAACWRRGSVPAASTAWAAALVAAALAALAPRALRWAYLGASYLTFPIGFVVSHVVLAVVYFAIFTPVGLLMRSLGRDPLTRRFEPSRSTYWEDRTTNKSPESYFHQS